MLRSASRAILRSSQSSLAPVRTTTVHRSLSTAPPHQRPRSWKSSAARWGLAIAAIYYYNTSELFAEQPAQYRLDPKADHDEPRDSISDLLGQPPDEKQKSRRSVLSSRASDGQGSAEKTSSDSPDSALDPTSASDAAELKEEASGEGAFNPETGEINWDCPCLGGMAHGPCGEEFRSAFSCFVFSEEEPKGINCIAKFQGMQDCFRAHPDVYSAELEGDDDPELDESLEEERKELVKEIQERREKNRQAAEGSGRTKRLLEDDPPMERKPLLSRSRPKQPPPPPNSSPPPSEPGSPRSEDREAEVVAEKPPPASGSEEVTKKEVFDQDLELMPKQWHDDRSGTISDTNDKN